jgi:hypothetical protein
MILHENGSSFHATARDLPGDRFDERREAIRRLAAGQVGRRAGGVSSVRCAM